MITLVAERHGQLIGYTYASVDGQDDKTSFGVEIGGGGNWMNYMLLGGSHFAEGGAKSKSLIELAHATVFMRTRLSESQHLDLGAKASAFLHFDSSDDEPGGGYFGAATNTSRCRP